MLDNPADADINSRHLISLLSEVVDAIIAAAETYPM